MRTIALGILTLTITATACAARAAAPADAVARRVEAAQAEYEKAAKRAQAAMTAQFEQQADALRAGKGAAARLSPEDRKSCLDVITLEKAAFARSGCVPLSLPMRAFTREYLAASTAAIASLEAAYAPAIDAYVKRKDNARADALTDELKSHRHAVVASFEINRIKRDLRLDGTLNDNGATWHITNDKLALRGPNNAWADNLKLRADGKVVAGRNNQNAPVIGHRTDLD